MVEEIEQPSRHRKDEQRAGDAVEDRNLARQGQADLEEKCGKTQVLRTSSLKRRIRHWSLVIITLQCNNSAEITAVESAIGLVHAAPPLDALVAVAEGQALDLQQRASCVDLEQFRARRVGGDGFQLLLGAHDARRSEEHTSELQSQFHLVCRLL